MRSLLMTATAMTALLATTGCQQGNQNHYSRDDVVDETYIHKYGVTVAPNDWSKRGKNGKVVAKLKNGVTETKTYLNGVLEGETTYTFPHSEAIEKIEFYDEGVLVKEIVHYSSGTPQEEVSYDSQNGTKTVSSWYENGSAKNIEQREGDLLLNGEYYNMSHQIESKVVGGTGNRVNRDQYGIHSSTDEFGNGLLVERTLFHPNGTPKENIPFERGIIQGNKRTYYPAGEPNTVELWVNGVQQGITLVYQNGEKFAEVPYIAGEKHGKEKRFRNGTEVVTEISWMNGRQHGPTIHHIAGKQEVEWFYNGSSMKKHQYDRMTKGIK